jgi:macrolide-specific efflux system membrane fusion protein
VTRKKQIIIIGTAIAAIAVAGAAIATLGGGREKGEAAFSLVPVERRDMGSVVQATGIIKPKVGAEVKVGARITGKVERLYANIGDRVKSGQVLVQLEQDDLKARVDQAQASSDEAAAVHEKAKSDLERDRELAKQGYLSEQALDNLRNAVDIARARLARARADLEYARAQLSYATIRAPLSGTIASVTTQAGETVAAGLNAPTFITIIDLSKLEVNAYVDETDIGKISAGQKALFTVDTFPDRDFSGTVTAVYPRAVLQENVVNYITLISIRDAEGRLKPDMTANVTITLQKRTGAIAVPGAAVRREGGRKYVLVMADGRQEKREVRTGWKDGGYMEITSGLTAGETVVVGEGSAAPGS